MTVKFTIEGWTWDVYEGTVDIDDEDLRDMSNIAREKLIEEIVQDAINNVVSWGWEIVADD